jgi:hypothetical protein
MKVYILVAIASSEDCYLKEIIDVYMRKENAEQAKLQLEEDDVYLVKETQCDPTKFEIIEKSVIA